MQALFVLLTRVVLTTPWSLRGQPPIGEGSERSRIGEHLFTDYLLPFELASVLLLMAMIGAIVLARRDVLRHRWILELVKLVDQGLIEKARTPLLVDQPPA